MLSCTFFGHRDTPGSVEVRLRDILVDLIVRRNVTVFYIGNHGTFDCVVRTVLRTLQKEYSHIRCVVVLAYLPREEENMFYGFETIYPEGMELVPPKFAIDRRNRWMVSHADYVVTYVNREGGASQYKKLAEKKKKIVYNLA